MPNFFSQVIYAALEDVQMSVKRCAIEVLGKLDLPPDSQDRMFGITGSRFEALEIGQLFGGSLYFKISKIDESGMIRITILGFIFQA